MKYNGKYIGANFVNGIKIGGIVSSYDGIFVDEEVLIGSGFDYIPCVIGNVDEALSILKEKIEEKVPKNFVELCACVFATVQEYFGDYSNIDYRMENYKDADYVESFEDIGKISDLRGKNAAMCVERAMLSQNLLKHLNINSYYKCSGIINDGKSEVHSYNLVEYADRCYIFDATIPTLINEEINPLIAEIPKDVFDMISSPLHGIGYSVEVMHYNPLREMDKDIIYDSGRDKFFVVKNNEKKL
jgi:hypothetical protein